MRGRAWRKQHRNNEFITRINGINLYKHSIVRMCSNFGDPGHCYISPGSRSFHRADSATELAKLETVLREVGRDLRECPRRGLYRRKRVKRYTEPGFRSCAWRSVE